MSGIAHAPLFEAFEDRQEIRRFNLRDRAVGEIGAHERYQLIATGPTSRRIVWHWDLGLRRRGGRG